MIDAVGTSMVQGASLRVTPQATSAYVASGGGAPASVADVPRYGTRLYVRLDSGAERAILEVRSSETGEVVKQYPSEAQMRAFQRAAKLEASQQQQQVAEQRASDVAQRDATVRADRAAASRTADTAAPVQNTAPAQPAPDLYQAAAPRQSAPAAPAPDTSSGSPVSSGGDAQGQSILV